MCVVKASGWPSDNNDCRWNKPLEKTNSYRQLLRRCAYEHVITDQISKYRAHIYTTLDVPQCELRVATITDRDQDSAFPLPDYAQVYNNKNKDRQTDVYIFWERELVTFGPGVFSGRGEGGRREKKSCGFRYCSVVKASGWPSDNNDSNDQEWSPGFFVPKKGFYRLVADFPGVFRLVADQKSDTIVRI